MYTMHRQSIKIKSNWFNVVDRKKSIVHRITHKGLNLYFNLHQFQIDSTATNDTFITSIERLRKKLPYSTTEVYDLLRVLSRTGLIKITNLSKWSYLKDDKGKIIDKFLLEIEAIDTPQVERTLETKGKIKTFTDKPITEDDSYISVSVSILNHYETLGLSERYLLLYCLMMKYRNGNAERKITMSIDKMAKIIGMDKDFINKMIHQMNNNRVLASYKRRGNTSTREKFEHYILPYATTESIEDFEKLHSKQLNTKITIAAKGEIDPQLDDVIEVFDDIL